jgi:hypothetical protein
MAAMKPRTGDGPLEVTKEGRGIVMRVPLEGGGRLVVEMTPDEATALGEALKLAVLSPPPTPPIHCNGTTPSGVVLFARTTRGRAARRLGGSQPCRAVLLASSQPCRAVLLASSQPCRAVLLAGSQN